MVTEEKVQRGTIADRMHRIHERMMLERISGVPAANKDLFLAKCRELTESGADALLSQIAKEEIAGWDEIHWEPFDNWGNAPAFLVRRER